MGQINKQNQHEDISDTPEPQGDPSPFETIDSIQSVQLRQLLDALTSGVSALVAAIDVNYRYLYFSQAYADEIKSLIGMDLRTGMTVMDVYKDTPRQLAFSLKQWNRSLQGEEFKEVVKFLRLDAGENFYEVTFRTIKDDNDVATGAVLVAKNITRRLDLEHSITESEMRYQQLFDHMFEGLAICEFLFDAAGQPTDYRVLDVNPNFTQILGSTREKIIGMTYLTSNHTLELFSLDRLSPVVFTGKPIHFEEFSPVHERYYDVFVYVLANNCFAILLSDITEKKSEQDHRDYLASFPEQNPMPVVEVNYQGKIIYQNPASQKFFSEKGGADGAQPFLEKINNFIAKYQAGEPSALSTNVLIGSTWLHLSFYHIPQLKRIRIYSVDITERVNAENELISLNRKLETTVTQRTEELNRLNQELTMDILRRQESENALEAERKRFNNVLEVLPVYVLLVKPDGHINFANKFFTDTFNWSGTDKCTEISLVRKNPGEIDETFKPLLGGQANLWEWVSPENRVYTVHDYPFTDVDGSPLVLEMGLDITEIRKAQEKLLETSNYNRSLIEANLDFLVTIDQDGIIGDVNAAAVMATGLSREELIGSRFESHFEDADAANRGIQLVLETGSVKNYELSIKHKDGYVTPVAYNASFYTDLQGKTVGIFAGARDLTELKRKESQLLELNHALEAAIEHETAIHDQLVQAEKFAAMGRMLASVTHEINNPLQTISNCLYLITSDIPAKSQAIQFLEMAISETERISKLVAALKDVYRPRQENSFVPIYLPSLLDKIYNLIKPQLSEKHVDWKIVSEIGSAAEKWVEGMDDQLKQVFINLSTNAIEAMQPDGGSIEVRITRGKNNEIGILFSDTGPGIAPENVNKIFEPFYSTKSQGLGLGLSICYEIIQRHNGHMDVSTILGKGSTFEVWLPGLKVKKRSER